MHSVVFDPRQKVMLRSPHFVSQIPLSLTAGAPHCLSTVKPPMHALILYTREEKVQQLPMTSHPASSVPGVLLIPRLCGCLCPFPLTPTAYLSCRESKGSEEQGCGVEGKVCGPFKGNSVSQTSDYRLAEC